MLTQSCCGEKENNSQVIRQAHASFQAPFQTGQVLTQERSAPISHPVGPEKPKSRASPDVVEFIWSDYATENEYVKNNKKYNSNINLQIWGLKYTSVFKIYISKMKLYVGPCQQVKIKAPF